MAITAFLSRSPGLLNRGPSLLGAGFLNRILYPTDWTSCAPSYIKVRRTPSSCGRQKSHSFNPSTVKVIFWYSSTGWTCYLHRCISYFDSPAGSEVNIQQNQKNICSQSHPKKLYSLIKFPRYALELIRRDISSNLGASLANALLLDLKAMGLLIPNININNIILDKYKVDWAKIKLKTTDQQKHDQYMKNLICIGVDGRMDRTHCCIRKLCWKMDKKTWKKLRDQNAI